jgi:NO-binding membrane sensor protein with MHYT domain
MLAAIVGSITGLFIVTRHQVVGWQTLLASSIFIGSAVISMHFTAMSALLVSAKQLHNPRLIFLSGAV